MNAFTQLNLAWRNLWRNSRRSLVTIVSLAFGFSAVALFAGYTSAVYVGLANMSIHGELIGHLSINRRGWLVQGKLDPAQYLLTQAQIEQVRRIVAQQLPGAVLMPRLSLSGMISNGHSSTIFIASGITPRDQMLLRGPLRHAPGGLQEGKPTGVTIAQGLADVLGLKTGDSAPVLSSTIHGQANAVDVDAQDIVDTGNSATNDKLMLMPLALAQDLIDAPGRAELLTVLLDGGRADAPAGDGGMFAERAPDEQQARALQAQLTAAFDQAGLDLEVRTWQQMSAFYRQVKGMYDIIFAMMMAVVLAIVVLSIANAMSMSVVERTREIGTLRAIGLRRRGVVTLFVVEALLLVLVGIVAGLALTALARYGVNLADIRYVPPGNTSTVPVYVGFDLARTAFAAATLALLAVAAAFIPARRAANHSITESLGHV